MWTPIDHNQLEATIISDNMQFECHSNGDGGDDNNNNYYNKNTINNNDVHNIKMIVIFCVSVERLPTTYVVSPGYPGRYPDNVEKHWMIQARPGKVCQQDMQWWKPLFTSSN